MREGEFGRDRVPVVSHALDIPARLKELDEGYFVMLNVRTQKFEIWREDGDGGVLECVLPYGELDERTIRHVREHRVERMQELIREAEEHNLRLEAEAKRRWLAEAGERTKEAMRYLDRHVGEEKIPIGLMGSGG
ncbi:MAG: hypothetical protein IJE08_04425 [Clostridia bacterium]|nr:hypothetical protein [Clostridia bacterium]